LKSNGSRRSYSKIEEKWDVEIPNLLDVQLQSFRGFLQNDVPTDQRKNEGLQEVFTSVFPISDTREMFSLEFVAFAIGDPKYSVEECQERDLTFSAPLKCTLRLRIREVEEGQKRDKEIIEQEVYLGELPLITSKGTFLINGAERVIVSQLHRSPGVVFEENTHPNGQRLISSRIITFRGPNLYALDPKTGEPIPTFGKNGVVDLAADVGPRSTGYRWNSVPLIARDVIVMGSAMVDQDSASKIEGDPGDVRAYDVRTGRLRWTFHVVPRAGDAAAIKTWVGDSWQYTGAGNVWSLMSADDDLGYVYLPTTSVTNDMYGGARLGDNLYSTSIVCVEAATGKRVWHYQTVHHDLFDYDNPAAPILADITVDGKRIKAVAQITKQSWAYVLDRVTGKPVWPIVEKPVPASTVPGEKTSPTPPVPAEPPAFARQGIP